MVPRRAPKYTIDLDLPPRYRWIHVAQDLKPHVKDLSKLLYSSLITEYGWFVGGWIVPFAVWVLSWWLWIYVTIFDTRMYHYIQELIGISDITTCHGLPFHMLIAFNYGYDFLAGCTSIAKKVNNKMWHLRNMDWVGNELKPVTIDCEFVMKGTVVYRTTTWLGMVGALTGQRLKCDYNYDNDPLTLSLNFRKDTGPVSPLRFILQIPIGFQIRNILYSTINTLKTTSELLGIKRNAPTDCYIVICNDYHGELHITPPINWSNAISSSPNRISDEIVQTNIDPHINTVDSTWAAGDPLLLSAIDRRKEAKHQMAKLSDVSTPDDMLKAMSAYPICNELTIYTTIMSPSGYYETWVW